MITTSSAGFAAVSACQSGCASLVVSCYAAGQATFGTVTAGAGTPAAILSCNSAFGVCEKACYSSFFLPW